MLNNKHFMTGAKGNSEFCFPETFHIEVGKEVKSAFKPSGPSGWNLSQFL